ncbi:hypothetical protein ASD11_15020 [Aeromicrobium sp. Root495]|uniref:hypothetical protein n=1 Tax=Aeromicrobium sp. Root495 TaxID=1736550 RepID=UPI0006FEF604|nr:hypothetical protein [Aeromicrobium sp. Root495]KQY55813.1 hypothetical protein ASD11_15020 [Aeromicrobium sp. Root495]
MALREWRVDPIQSFLHGTDLAEKVGSADPGRRDKERTPADAWAEAVFVAICHSTNWDKLRSAIMTASASDPHSVSPPALVNLSPDGFMTLTGLAHPLEDESSRRRLEILHELGKEAVPSGLWSLAKATQSLEVLLQGETGAYAVLARVSAFNGDPLQKKSRVLIHQWLNAHDFTFTDSENVRPAIDYHLIRLYMRTGRIQPRHRRSFQHFSDGRPVAERELTAMRSAVESALYYTASGADVTVDHLNHLEWQIARSFCTREEARCSEGPIPSKPVDVALAVASDRTGGCPYNQVCRGARAPDMRALVEPQSIDEHY